MKLNITKGWLAHKLELESGSDVAAGLPALSPQAPECIPAPIVSDTRLALGPLIQLMRRKHGMSIEGLAERARINLVEALSLERDSNFRPEPRTLYQVAQVLGLPAKSLFQLSGSTVVRDSGFRDAAVRFAARSESLERLSSEEQKVLEEYVVFLGSQG